MPDTKSSLTCELIQAIHQTDEWDRIWTHDPAIRDVAARPADLSHYVIDRAAQMGMGQNG